MPLTARDFCDRMQQNARNANEEWEKYFAWDNRDHGNDVFFMKISISGNPKKQGSLVINATKKLFKVWSTKELYDKISNISNDGDKPNGWTRSLENDNIIFRKEGEEGEKIIKIIKKEEGKLYNVLEMKSSDWHYEENIDSICTDITIVFNFLKEFGCFEFETGQNPLLCKTSELPRNLIVFGAPGTGKSHLLEKLRKCKISGENNDSTDDLFFKDYRRVTFYPTYSYSQFVGTYKPVMKKKNGESSADNSQTNTTNGESSADNSQTNTTNGGGQENRQNRQKDEDISYEFVPGPFLELLKKAMKQENNQNRYLLIIEEINRANAAAVFGDVFQLLDRKPTGESEYEITPNHDIRVWWTGSETEGDGTELKLALPKNLYIWATMNSADQGVFPLDTAFKRRWEFVYLGVDDKQKDMPQWTVDSRDITFGTSSNSSNDWQQWQVETQKGLYQWKALREAINNSLAKYVNEDKLLGPWFVSPTNGNTISMYAFINKVLMYLWEDAARMCRTKFFKGEINKFSDLIQKWKECSENENNNNTTGLCSIIPDIKFPNPKKEFFPKDDEINIVRGNVNYKWSDLRHAIYELIDKFSFENEVLNDLNGILENNPTSENFVDEILVRLFSIIPERSRSYFFTPNEVGETPNEAEIRGRWNVDENAVTSSICEIFPFDVFGITPPESQLNTPPEHQPNRENN